MTRHKKISYGGGNYYVTDDGKVYNEASGKYLCPRTKKTGYQEVQLSSHGVRKFCLLHRLVASAFCEGDGEVNHKNGNKEDNRAENLEWVSHGENLRHSYETGLRLDDVTPRPVRAVNMDTGESLMFESIYSAARFMGISQGNICMVCKGRRPSASGYIFEYATGGEND